MTDRYHDGTGSLDATVLGRWSFLHAAGVDTARAAAGRAAAESIWVPATLLPEGGVTWRAESEDVIVASVEVPPERPDVWLGIDEHGAVRAVSLMRWGDVGREGFGYIPFGGEMRAEHRFGSVTLPSEVSIGWWYGTPRYRPFFEASILDAEPTGLRPRNAGVRQPEHAPLRSEHARDAMPPR